VGGMRRDTIATADYDSNIVYSGCVVGKQNFQRQAWQSVYNFVGHTPGPKPSMPSMRYSVRYNVCNLWFQTIVCGIGYEGSI
jgi:hypothetical protein